MQKHQTSPLPAFSWCPLKRMNISLVEMILWSTFSRNYAIPSLSGTVIESRSTAWVEWEKHRLHLHMCIQKGPTTTQFSGSVASIKQPCSPGFNRLRRKQSARLEQVRLTRLK